MFWLSRRRVFFVFCTMDAVDAKLAWYLSTFQEDKAFDSRYKTSKFRMRWTLEMRRLFKRAFLQAPESCVCVFASCSFSLLLTYCIMY